jgi:hypothetical protein
MFIRLYCGGNMIFLLPALVSLQEPVELKTRVAEASVFKSGLVMLTREVVIPVGDAKYRLDVVPEALDGTFWYTSPDGLALSDVETIFRIQERKEKIPARSIAEILQTNVGKSVTLGVLLTPGAADLTRISGTIFSVPTVNLVNIRTDAGMLRAIAATTIVEVDPSGLTLEVEQTMRVPELHLQFQAKTTRPARLHFTTLESGAAWVGTYHADLLKDGLARVEGKAQVGVGPLRFVDTQVSAVAGAPNLPTAVKYDLSAGYGSLMAYLTGQQANYRQYRPGEVDPFTLLPTLLDPNRQRMAQSVAIPGFGGMGGGMGGGAFDVGQFAPGATDGPRGGIMRRDDAGEFRIVPDQARADRVEGLFTYPLGKVSLEPGDRMSRVLFAQNAPYSTLFIWNADAANTRVSNILRLRNSSKVPWTGGLIFIVKNGTPLAQVQMPFTPVASDADLEMGAAQDIVVTRDDSQLRLEEYPAAEHPQLLLRRSINEHRLRAHNTRDEPAELEIRMQVVGDVLAPDGAEVQQLTTRADAFNWNRRLTWRLNLAPNERRELKPVIATVFQAGVRGIPGQRPPGGQAN